MQLQNKLKTLGTPRNIIILLVLIFVVLPLLIYATSFRKTNLDKLPVDSSEADYTKVANIKDGIELLKVLGADRYNAFSEDLFVYAKESINGYKNNDKVVGFEIINKIEKQESKVTFDGRYGSGKNTVKVSIDELANGRIKVSIIDNKTKQSVNDKLPSNSTRNIYIAKLPISGEGYMIDFNLSLDTIQLFVYSRDTALVISAQESIKKEIGESFKESMVNVTFPQPEVRELNTQEKPPTFINDQGQTIYIEGS